MKNVKKNYIFNSMLIALIIIQLLYMVYWAAQKSGYYVDEFFTFDNAHYISASTPERIKLYDADFMEYNKWFDVLEVKSTLTVQKEESLLNDSLIDNIKVFLKNKPYMAILNYVEAIFFEGKLTWWSSISINIVCFLLNQIFMYLLTKKLCKKRTTALLAMVMYGFCGMAISMLVYVRMYMWLTLLVTVFTYLHILMWDEETHWKNGLLEISFLILLFLAYRNSPLPVIYGIALIGCFLLGLLLRKRWIQSLYYAVPIIGGGIVFAVTQTDYIKILQNPQVALDSGKLAAPIAALIGSMLSLDGAGFIERMNNIFRIVNRFLFGYFGITFLYGILVAGLVFIAVRKSRQASNDSKSYKSSFIYVLCGALILFFIGAIIFGLGLIRYISFVFPLISICIMFFIMYFSEKIKKEKLVIVAVGILILGQILFTVKIPRIENLYIEDREPINNIQQLKGINSLVVDYHFDDKIMYECLAYTDENTKVMFSSYDDMEYSQLGDTILVWQSVNRSAEELEHNLMNAGYTSVQNIAETHESRVFLCLK